MSCVLLTFVCSLTGIGEIVLLPLDVLKIKRQTNPEAFRSRGFFRIVSDEGFALYRGWGWTAARNAPGSFALFGGSAFTKEYVFGLEDFGKATWTQNFFSSIGGAVASITVSAPLDVVKTRIQNANFESKTGGGAIIKDMIKNEGMSAFFKGLTPKVSCLTRCLAYIDHEIPDPRRGPQAVRDQFVASCPHFPVSHLLLSSVFSFTVAQSLIPLFGKVRE